MTLMRIILGLLSIAPMSGYDVKRHFDSTINHFWSADKAQIYRALSALVDEGLASTRIIPGDGAPDRVEHKITAAGRRALGSWLVGDVERQPERDAFLARLFFAESLDEPELSELLAGRRARIESLLDTLEQMRAEHTDGENRGQRLRLATLENGILHAETELAWLEGLSV